MRISKLLQEEHSSSGHLLLAAFAEKPESMLRGYRVVSSPVQVTSTKTCIVLSSFYRLDGCYVLVEKPDFSSFCARGKGVHHTIKDDGEGKLGMTGSIKLGQVK